MLFQSLLFLAVAAPLVFSGPDKDAIVRRTGDDDIKEQNVSVPAASTIPATPMQVSSRSDLEDKLLLPESVQFTKSPATLSSPDDANALLTSTSTSIDDKQSTFVGKDDKSTGPAVKSKDVPIFLASKDNKITSTASLPYSTISSISISPPSKADNNFLKDVKNFPQADSITSKDDKFLSNKNKSMPDGDRILSEDDKILHLPNASTSYNSGSSASFTAIEIRSSRVASPYTSVNDKTSGLQDKNKGFQISLRATISETAGKDTITSKSLPFKDEKSQYLPSYDKIPETLEIVYSVTISLGHLSAPISSNGSFQSSSLAKTISHSTATSSLVHAPYPMSLPRSTVSFGEVPKVDFPGYQIVPSPTKVPSKGFEGYTASVIPVYTPAMLGNAYGGGFVITPSIYVSRRPFPSGPAEGIPPGYGSYSKPEFSFAELGLPLNSTGEKNRTFVFGIPTVTNSIKAEALGPRQSVASVLPSRLRISTGPSKSETDTTLNLKKDSKKASLAHGNNGGNNTLVDIATSVKTDKLIIGSSESGPSVRYITEETSTTATYHSTTTVSGNASIVSSITLTKILTTVYMITVSETENLSLPQITGVNSLRKPSPLPSNVGYTMTGISSSILGAPFLNSTVRTATYTKQSIVSQAASEKKITLLGISKESEATSGFSVLTEAGKTIESLEILTSSTKTVSAASQARTVTSSIVTSKYFNKDESLSGTVISGSETEGLQLNAAEKTSSGITQALLLNTGGILVAPISSSEAVLSELKPVLSSLGMEILVETRVTASVVPGSLSLSSSSMINTGTDVATISLLGPEIASLSNSREVIDSMKPTETVLLGSQFPLYSGSVGLVVSTRASVVNSAGQQSSSQLSLFGTSIPTIIAFDSSPKLELSSANGSSRQNRQMESKVAILLSSTLFESSSTFTGTSQLGLSLPTPIVSSGGSVGSLATLSFGSALAFETLSSQEGSTTITRLGAGMSVSTTLESAPEEIASSVPALDVESSSSVMLGLLLPSATSAAGVTGEALGMQSTLSEPQAAPFASNSRAAVSTFLQESVSPTGLGISPSLTASVPKVMSSEQGAPLNSLASPLEIKSEKSETIQSSRAILHASANAETTASRGSSKSEELSKSAVDILITGEAPAFSATLESLAISHLSLGFSHSTLGASQSEASQFTEASIFAITASHSALASLIPGTTEATEIHFSIASASPAVPVSSPSKISQVTTAQESGVGPSPSTSTLRSSEAFEIVKGQDSVFSSSIVIQSTSSGETLTISGALQAATTHALKSFQPEVASGAIDSTEALGTLVSASNSAQGASSSLGLAPLIALNKAELLTQNSRSVSEFGARSSSTTETTTLLMELNWASASITQSGNLPVTSLASASGPSEEVGPLASLSTILASAVLNSPSESNLELGNSIAAIGSAFTTTQAITPTSTTPQRGTKADISSNSAIKTYGKSNDSVSVNIKPTAVLPFLGIGAKMSASCTFVLVAILATFIVV